MKSVHTYARGASHPLFGPVPPPKPSVFRPAQSDLAPLPPPTPPPPPPSPSSCLLSLQEKITSEFTHGILEYSCELYILSLINQIGPRVSLVGSASYGEEDVGTLDKWCDNTWHTLTGNPIDDGELERKGEIELARPDPFFRSDVDAGARFAVVYETRWRRKGDEDWGPVVRWKRVFMTGDQACEGYLWGAKQGWSIPFVYDELPAQELNGWRWSGCCEKVGCPRDHHLRMLGQY